VLVIDHDGVGEYDRDVVRILMEPGIVENFEEDAHFVLVLDQFGKAENIDIKEERFGHGGAGVKSAVG
jgi:hypothetical protein